jgi:hypothetical protein
MDSWIKQAITGFLLFLICCCIFRQKRYWRELTTNKPSGTLRAGYALAVFTVGTALVASLCWQTESMWQLFLSILLMTLVFCVKITFSPAVIALSLAVCTFQFYTNSSFPFFEVWTGFIGVLTWRLPEEVRVAYACLSFTWALIALLFGGAPPEAADGTLAADNVTDTIANLHA